MLCHVMSVLCCYVMPCQCYFMFVVLCYIVLWVEGLLRRRFKHCPEPVWDEAGLFEAILLLHSTPVLCRLPYRRLHYSIESWQFHCSCFPFFSRRALSWVLIVYITNRLLHRLKIDPTLTEC